jgi:PBP1b-binding outer membrane lipoprotein LpoB
MKVMTRKTAARRLAWPPTWVGSSGVVMSLTLFILLLLLLLVLPGCESRALEEAQQEARDAQVTIERLKHNLNEATREISRLKAELGAVRQTRDEVQGDTARLIQERDQALALAQQTQETVAQLTARASGQVTAATAFERQIADLKALVAEQQKLIEQLQKGATVEPPVEGTEEPLPAEPNNNS